MMHSRIWWTMFFVSALLAATILTFVTSRAQAQTDCSDLIQACKMKRQLGEQGQGNCKAARACQQQLCGELRQACLHKQELGEQGQGNCRRYRETCRR
jgi:hypothetical protein